MVFMPPRHGKSQLTSVQFPAWYLGRNPSKEVVVSGYSGELTRKHSRLARDLYTSPEYGEIFHNSRKNAVDRESEWGTEQGGSFYAVGVGGALTGRGANIGIIDDPVKDRAEAQSHTIRAKVLDWYRSTFRSRIMPEGAIIIVMTRWHPDDLAGVLLQEANEGGEQWEVIKLPAVNDAGEALWPDMWPISELDLIKASVGSYEWSSLYQQEPTIRGGNIFKTAGVRIYDTTEGWPDVRPLRCWDLASTAKERGKNDPDYTFGVKGFIHTQNGLPHLYVLDAVYGQWDAPERDRAILSAHSRDDQSCKWYIEAFGGYKDTFTNFRHMLKGKRVVHKSQLTGDKLTKASPLEPIFEAGNVHILRGGWNEIWLRQFEQFDGQGGSHDDAVDATAMIWHQYRKPRARVVSLG